MSVLVEKTLNIALECNYPAKIIYLSDNKFTQRVIEVKCIRKNKVSAYCHLRGKIRIFNINNILSAQIMSKLD